MRYVLWVIEPRNYLTQEVPDRQSTRGSSDSRQDVAFSLQAQYSPPPPQRQTSKVKPEISTLSRYSKSDRERDTNDTQYSSHHCRISRLSRRLQCGSTCRRRILSGFHPAHGSHSHTHDFEAIGTAPARRGAAGRRPQMAHPAVVLPRSQYGTRGVVGIEMCADVPGGSVAAGRGGR